MRPFFGVLRFSRSSLGHVSSQWGRKMSTLGRALASMLIRETDQQWSMAGLVITVIWTPHREHSNVRLLK